MKHAVSVITAIAISISLLLMFTACSSSYTNDKALSVEPDQETTMEAPSMQGTTVAMDKSDDSVIYNDDLSNVATQNRKIVKHSYLTLETKEFDSALDQIFSAIKEQGGYIESQSTNGQSLYNNSSYYEHTASICARIPADKLDEVSSKVSGLCNVTSRNESIDDITDSYFDVEAHLNSLKMQEERLLDILSKSEKLEDVISLEQALSDVRYQIESLTSTIRRMDSQISYSYLNIELREVVEYQPTEPAPRTLGERIAASVKRSGDKIVWFFESLLFFVIEDLPLSIIWIAILALIGFLSFKFSLFAKNKMNNKQHINSSPDAKSIKKESSDK